ncbi:MAG: fibronectin type III domain-containing protein [Candidatus Gracilibacteria bacterium]
MAHVYKVLPLSALIGALACVLSLAGGVLTSAEIIDTSTLPSTVEGLAVIPGDGEVTLTWDAATDDTGVEGYYVYVGLLSVVDEGGSYTFPSSDAGNATTYTVENLSNGVTYYFAVTAYDADGNESEFYSNEVEATPESSEIADYTAPTVKSAIAVSSSLVEVQFSEVVELPSDPTSAFALTATDGTALQVIDAYLSDDPTTVFIVTGVQDPDSEYELTAGIGISDTSGNPIESGTSDTAFFTGSGVAEEEIPTLENTDNTNDTFVVEDVDATEVNELELTFSQEVVSADVDSFKIQLADDASEEIEVLAVSIDEDDATKVTLVTEEMDAGYDYVLTMDELVFNKDGNAMTEENMSVDFTSKTLDLADLIAPEDITNLLSEVSGETSVLLTWTASMDTAGDLAEYWLRQSMDGGVTFGDALEIASSAVDYEVDDLTADETYTFKVTAVDGSGNESEGVLTTVTLPESGPELLVLGALSLLGAGAWNRKKKNKL